MFVCDFNFVIVNLHVHFINSFSYLPGEFKYWQTNLDFIFPITLYRMSKISFFQIKSISDDKHYSKHRMSFIRKQTLWEKKKMLFTIFLFYQNVLKGIFLKCVKSHHFCGKGKKKDCILCELSLGNLFKLL